MFVATSHGFFNNFSLSLVMQERSPKAQPSTLANCTQHSSHKRCTCVNCQYRLYRGSSKLTHPPRCIAALPLTLAKIELAGSLLVKGGYRSGQGYLSAMRRRHIYAGFSWSEDLCLARADAALALRRGQGPAQAAAELPMEAIMLLYNAIVVQLDLA